MVFQGHGFGPIAVTFTKSISGRLDSEVASEVGSIRWKSQRNNHKSDSTHDE